ncbi:MAG: hypothetical protein RJB58_1209 [Pseudomonadota bacterium]
MKVSKGNTTKPIKIQSGGGKGTKTLGGTKKSPAAFSAKGVKQGAGNRF